MRPRQTSAFSCVVPQFRLARRSERGDSFVLQNDFEPVFTTAAAHRASLTASDKFELASDKMTLTINLNTAKAQYAKDTFKVKGNVVTGDNASTTTVPVFTKELTFSDVTVPTVKAVTVKGNKKITVEFSEAVNMVSFASAAGTSFKIDGQYLTNYGFDSTATTVLNQTASNYANKIELYFATAIPAGNHTLTTLKSDGTNLIDAAGFKVAEQTNDFTVVSVSDAPTVSSITGETNGTIYVTYNRSMGSSALTATNYQMNGTNLITAGTFKSGSGDTIVKLTGVPNISKGVNVLTIVKDTVSDSYGNKVDKNNDTRVSFTATEDTTKPTVTSVTALSNTKIRVKFSEAVNSAYATNTSNYTLKDSSNSTISISSITTVASDTYDLTTPALTGSNYTLKIKNIVDTASTANTIDEYTATFNGTDDVAPQATSAIKVASSVNKVAVLFNESMDVATISNTANYFYIDGTGATKALPSGTTIAAGADNKSVEVTLPSSYKTDGSATGEYNVVGFVVGSVKDVAGNTLQNFSRTFATLSAAISGTAATYVADTFKVTATDTKVTVEFELNQNITSLAKADFLVGAGDSTTANVNNVVADSAYVSGKKVVLEYTTTSSMNLIKGLGTSLKLVTVASPASTNIYGTPVAAIGTASAKSVYEDAIAPKLSSIAIDSTDASKIIVTFTEAIDQTITGLYKNDFTVESNGQVVDISSVTTLAANKIVLNLASPLTTSATVKVASVVDIKDLANDGAETSNMYVPTTDDKNGINGSISAASVTAVYAADIAVAKTALTYTYDGVTETALTLPTTGANGTTITWAETTDASNVGTLVGSTLTFTRSSADDVNDTYVLTATITKGGVSDTKAFTLTVNENKAPVVTGVTEGQTLSLAATPAGLAPAFVEGTATLAKDGGAATVFTSGTAVNVAGVYVLTVTDAAGNVTTVNFTITA